MKSILDPQFRYIPAVAHGDVNEFRERQRKRAEAAQSNSFVGPIKLVVLDQRTARKT